jgi:hypothetical protein
MKNAWIVLLIPAFASCVAPVNLPFESARMLKKGEVDVQGNLSAYLASGDMVNTNFGGKVGFGLTDEHTLKLRYERLRPVSVEYQFSGSSYDSQMPAVDYFEMENKFKTGRRSAFGLTLGYYSFKVFSLDPRYYITFSNPENTFEFTLAPKLHIFLGEQTSFMPGLSLGFGLSSDLDRWALRPEVGWDGYVSYGAALTINLSKGK